MGDRRFDGTAFFRRENMHLIIVDRIFKLAFFDLNYSPLAFLG